MGEGIDSSIDIGGKLPDVVLMIGIITVLNTGLKLQLALRHQGLGIELIHKHSPFLRRVRRA